MKRSPFNLYRVFGLTAIIFVLVALIAVLTVLVLSADLNSSKSRSPEDIIFTGKQLESHLSRLSQYSEVMACVQEYEQAQGEADSALADRVSILAQKGMSYCADEDISLQQIIEGYYQPAGEPRIWMIEPKSCTDLLHELHLYCPVLLLKG